MRDDLGRRLFRTDAEAFKAQRSSARLHGIYSAVVRIGDRWALMHDPLADLDDV